MEIIKIHYKISKPVAAYKEIKAEAEVMKRFVVRGQFKGYYNKAFAIAHCQVSETPMSFFVVDPNCVRPKDKKDKMFEAQVIINPKILEAPTVRRLMNDDENSDDKILTVPNTIEYKEPCLSMPYRQPKRVLRYNWIRVRYQIPFMWNMSRLKTIEAELEGIASEIFQYCYDLTQGKNIYFESETPVKWWELIGTAKSQGGTSLDDPAGLNLSKSSEKPSDANMAK